MEYNYFYISLVLGLILWMIKFKSFFITIMTMLVLMAGIPLSLIINRGLFYIDYFVEWHVLAAFIVSNIGS